MRGVLQVWLVLSCLFVAGFGSLHGQPPPPPQPAPVEKGEPAPAAPGAPAKYERDGSTMLVHYLLAAIATILILVLICMPVRRE